MNKATDIISVWAENDGTIIVSRDDVDADGNVDSSRTLRTFAADEADEAREYAIGASHCYVGGVDTTLPVHESL